MKIVLQWLSAIFLWAGLASMAHAEQCRGREYIGHVQSFDNDVRIVDGRTTASRQLSGDDANFRAEAGIICSGDEVRVGSDSHAFLLLIELNSLVRLAESSVLVLGRTERAGYREVLAAIEASGPVDLCLQVLSKSWLRLRQGALRLFTTQEQNLDIYTEFMNASIEGTEFSVLVTEELTRVDVVQGEVAICNAQGPDTPSLQSGESGRSKGGAAPELISPQDAAQWAVFFPEINVDHALAPATRRAIELARLGRVEEGLKLIADSDAAFELAVKAIMQLMLNDTESASDDATMALSSDNQEPSAWLALSYVQQARFRLGQALDSIRSARDLAPLRADLWIREVELLQINGFHRRAREEAIYLVRRFPDIARAHSAAGFLELHDHELPSAKRSFEAAMLLDQRDPLSRLGLGLSHMREGDYSRARQELEIAVNLSPLQSMLRSYLGRIYLELGLREQAAEQLELAVALDANDPIPRLFNAFVEQQQGRVPAALAELDASIDRVERRAAYRSSIDRDADMAVVLSSRARIYEQMGFGNLTLLDGAESLQEDPGSYVGHRLMADAFLKRPRQELSRQSELLQAKLRQPLNNNPNQYRLYDSRLDALRDVGPFASSFNEYTRLFSREGMSGNLGGVVGSHGTRGIEGQFTVLGRRTLAALSAYEASTEGLRGNRDERLGITSIFLQRRLTNRLEWQAEHQYSDFEGGDDYLGFERAVHDERARNRESQSASRVSAHLRPDAASSWLVNLEHGRVRDDSDEHREGAIRTRDRLQGEVMDVQYTRSLLSGDIVGGILLSQQEQTFREFGIGAGDAQGLLAQERRDVRESSLYAYWYKPVYDGLDTRLDALLGLSIDRGSGRRGRDGESLNPKLGLSWKRHGTRVRLTAARTVKRTLISRRSLEPSQVMGFSQTLDQPWVDHSRLLAWGVDHSFARRRASAIGRTRVGVEYSHRQTVVASEAVRKPQSVEQELKMFLYIPWSATALSMEWSVSDWAWREAIGLPTNEIKTRQRSVGLTHRLDLGLKQFLSDSLSLSAVARWRAQDGRFYNFSSNFYREGVSRFLTFDALFEWRLSGLSQTGFRTRLSIGVENVLDERFRFEDEDPLDPRVAYERTVLLRLETRF
ncbi:hypothetical protein ACUNV4_08340 [Granulosicoccus sp. 3-233]|uniref:hypothetical protein n=1 Tax=Granulosicoccus sp. 3-233 TaxID=3417969 RepID=UPI003D326FAC